MADRRILKLRVRGSFAGLARAGCLVLCKSIRLYFSRPLEILIRYSSFRDVVKAARDCGPLAHGGASIIQGNTLREYDTDRMFCVQRQRRAGYAGLPWDGGGVWW